MNTMNGERVAIAGWGTLESWPEEVPLSERGPRWMRPWKARLLGLGRLFADAVGVALEAVLVLLPRV